MSATRSLVSSQGAELTFRAKEKGVMGLENEQDEDEQEKPSLRQRH